MSQATPRPDQGNCQAGGLWPGPGIVCVNLFSADGMVYALGGMGPDTAPQAQVRVYEPRRDCWLSLPSMPTPCYGASTFLHGNKIYVLGKDLGICQSGLKSRSFKFIPIC